MASLVWHVEDENARETPVDVRRIDGLVDLGAVAIPAFVKLDVEGGEGSALVGFSQTLSRYRPVILVEVSDLGRRTAWDLLQENGYRVHRVVRGLPVVRDLESFRHMDAIAFPPQSPSDRNGVPSTRSTGHDGLPPGTSAERRCARRHQHSSPMR